MAGEPIVRIRDLSKVYEQSAIQATALDRVLLDIAAREFLRQPGTAGRDRAGACDRPEPRRGR